jgi:ribose transport system substrate-binding protein
MDSAEHRELAAEMASYIPSQPSRRNFLRNAALLGAALPVTGLALEACGSSASSGAGGTGAAKTKGRSGYFFDSLADEWYIDESNGAKQAMAALSVPLQIYTFGTDPTSQIGEVQTAISSQTDMMAIYTPLGQGLQQIYTTASRSNAFFDLEADIPPWTYPSKYGDAFAAYVTADTAPAAEAAATSAFKQLGGSPKVVWMAAIPGGQDNEQSQVGFQAALTNNPQVQLLAQGNGLYSREPAFNLMASWLSRYPHIDVVLSHADTQSLGIYEAMQKAGRTNIKIVSVNGQLEGLQAVQQGHIYSTVFKGPLATGAWRMAHLFDVANGFKPTPLERMFWFGCFVVTKENVGKALSYYQQKTLPYDWKKMSRVLHPSDWEMQMPMMPINPVTFWAQRNLGKSEPGDWLPADVRTSINAGGFDKLVNLYKKHIGNNPLSSYGVVMQPEYGTF